MFNMGSDEHVSSMVRILSQCICISDHHVVHFKYIKVLYFHNKNRKKKKITSKLLCLAVQTPAPIHLYSFFFGQPHPCHPSYINSTLKPTKALSNPQVQYAFQVSLTSHRFFPLSGISFFLSCLPGQLLFILQSPSQKTSVCVAPLMSSKSDNYSLLCASTAHNSMQFYYTIHSAVYSQRPALG